MIQTDANLAKRISVAPMLDWTDRHYRFLARLLCKNSRLYTEMIHMGAIVFGDRSHFLQYHPSEHPVALQLGGSDPVQLGKAAHIAGEYGFDEINLNCGCPSPKVQKGAFGAILMQHVELVGDCLKAMQDNTPAEVTIKHRIGIDDQNSYAYLSDFVGQLVHKTQCKTFIIHARNAWLKGLSPKKNREIPPLKYDFVYQLKQDFPNLTIILNGGIKNNSEIALHLQQVDGVMVGREAYQHPLIMQYWDQLFFNDEYVEEVNTLIEKLYLYSKYELEKKSETHIRQITRHLLGLFHGQAHARIWRQMLSDAELLKQNRAEIILEAYQAMLQ